jgi:ADP-heptose:LPS heptosyltransferase
VSRPRAFRGVPLRPDRPVVDSLLQLTTVLGIPDAGRHLEFPLRSSDRALARHVLADAGVPTSPPPVVVHAGASVGFRRWPARRFAAVIDHLTAEYDVAVLLTGSASERELAESIRSRVARPERAVNLAGSSPDLGSLAALLAGAQLIVCNNTGVVHVAAAVGTPSVVLFGLSYERTLWGLCDPARQVGLTAPDGWQDKGHAAAIRQIQVAEVTTAVDYLLTGSSAGRPRPDGNLTGPGGGGAAPVT